MKKMKKRVLACLLFAGIGCLLNVTAQTQKITGEILDEDYYPVKNATIKVKGTRQSTATDKNGRFVLEGAPLTRDTLEATKGRRQNRSIEVPMKIQMRSQVIAKRFSWFVKAGIGVSQFTGAENILFSEANPSGNITCYGGAGVDIKLGKHWAFQPAVMLTYCQIEDGYGYYNNNQNDGYGNKTIQNPFYLEFPLLFALKYKVAQRTNIVFNIGSYVSLGISGDQVSYDYNYVYNEGSHSFEEKKQTTPLFGRRFTGGAITGLGFEIRDHILVGTSFKVGASSMDHCNGYMTLSMEVGYKF